MAKNGKPALRDNKNLLWNSSWNIIKKYFILHLAFVPLESHFHSASDIFPLKLNLLNYDKIFFASGIRCVIKIGLGNAEKL